MSFGFTTQRNDGYIKLLAYGARWYDARLGRFISADSIVPGMFNPVAFDRFGYVFNNPIRFNDPSGHACYDPGTDAITSENCNGGTTFVTEEWGRDEWEASGVSFVGNGWTDENISEVIDALNEVRNTIGITAMREALDLVHGLIFYGYATSKEF